MNWIWWNMIPGFNLFDASGLNITEICLQVSISSHCVHMNMMKYAYYVPCGVCMLSMWVHMGSYGLIWTHMCGAQGQSWVISGPGPRTVPPEAIFRPLRSQNTCFLAGLWPNWSRPPSKPDVFSNVAFMQAGTSKHVFFRGVMAQPVPGHRRNPMFFSNVAFMQAGASKSTPLRNLRRSQLF